MSNTTTQDCSQSQAIKYAQSLQLVVTANVTNYESWESYYLSPQFNETGTVLNPSWLYEIDHCLSEKVPEICQLQTAHYVWLIVVVCNAIKLFCMFFCERALSSSPLVVVGDAVASYLNDPDKHTEGNCLMSAQTAGKPPLPNGRVWRQKRKFWLRSSSRWSWCKTIGL
jgi:hypothetical protein